MSGRPDFERAAWVRPPEPICNLDHVGVRAPSIALSGQILPVRSQPVPSDFRGSPTCLVCPRQRQVKAQQLTPPVKGGPDSFVITATHIEAGLYAPDFTGPFRSET
jgi:hypothetical protein